MKAIDHFNGLVQDRQNRGATFSDAYQQVIQAHPDVKTLAIAAGRPPSRKAQAAALANSKEDETEEISPQEQERAGHEFISEVKAYQAKYPDVSYPAAWGRCKTLFSDLYYKISRNHGKVSLSAEAFPSSADSVANAFDKRIKVAIPNSSVPPMACPMNNTLMSLPFDASQDEMDTAWESNGSKMEPLDHAKVFEGLVGLLQTKGGASYDTALAAAKRRYTALWSGVEVAAK